MSYDLRFVSVFLLWIKKVNGWLFCCWLDVRNHWPWFPLNKKEATIWKTHFSVVASVILQEGQFNIHFKNNTINYLGMSLPLKSPDCFSDCMHFVWYYVCWWCKGWFHCLNNHKVYKSTSIYLNKLLMLKNILLLSMEVYFLQCWINIQCYLMVFWNHTLINLFI